MRKRFSLLALLSLLLMAVVPAGTALAAKPVYFVAKGPVAVTSISAPIPAGVSGRVRITSETLASILPLKAPPGFPNALDGKVLVIEQKSNELFSSPDLTTAVALDGSSKGNFQVIDPSNGAQVAVGQYHLNVSNLAPGDPPVYSGCQIYDSGNWSTTDGSGLKGRGTVTACLNFVDLDGPGPLPPTFAGIVRFEGTLN